MEKRAKVLLLIPLIFFFVSILVVLFSPVKIIPCETSQSTPATSWTNDQCVGYYLAVNKINLPSELNINNSALLINLIILGCGSFLINGILFLLLFIFVGLKGDFKVKHIDDFQDQPIDEAPKQKEIEDVIQEKPARRKINLDFLKNAFKKKPGQKFKFFKTKKKEKFHTDLAENADEDFNEEDL